MTADEIHAAGMALIREGERILAQLPTDYFASDMDRRHGDSVRGERIEASEIEGVS